MNDASMINYCARFIFSFNFLIACEKHEPRWMKLQCDVLLEQRKSPVGRFSAATSVHLNNQSSSIDFFIVFGILCSKFCSMNDLKS